MRCVRWSEDGSGGHLIRLKAPPHIAPFLIHIRPFIQYEKDKRGIPPAQPVTIRVRLIGDGSIRIQYAWEERMHELFLKYLELEKTMWMLSTLGGAYSAMGDYDRRFAVNATRISMRQLEIARELGDEVAEYRCHLYIALALAQFEYFEQAKTIVRRIFRRGCRHHSDLLVSCSRGVFGKIKSIELEIREDRYQPINRIV